MKAWIENAIKALIVLIAIGVGVLVFDASPASVPADTIEPATTTTLPDGCVWSDADDAYHCDGAEE